jgi:hypothetical protein
MLGFILNLHFLCTALHVHTTVSDLHTKMKNISSFNKVPQGLGNHSLENTQDQFDFQHSINDVSNILAYSVMSIGKKMVLWYIKSWPIF